MTPPKINNILYQLEETWFSLKEHKRRNMLTGFGISWGIFILILLVGAGNGLQKGVMILFQDYNQNSFWVYGGKTSLVEPGKQANQKIIFQQEDLHQLQQWFPEIETSSWEMPYAASYLRSQTKSYNRFECVGIENTYFQIKTFRTSQGRLLNKLDDELQRNVVLIGEDIAKGLFDSSNALGEYICIDDNWFQVIGVLESNSLFSDNKNKVYMPFSCLQNMFANSKPLTCFAFMLQKEASPKLFEKTLLAYLSKKYDFNIDDKNAIYINNLNSNSSSLKSLFGTINGFLWMVGFCMLLSGIVGVSNIMLVVVKERTQEIGVRKAIGATPKSILYMILNESVIITLIAGFVGLISASILVYLINFLIGDMIADKNSIFKGLSVNIPIAIGAIITLVFSGAMAGLYPARKAASVLPIKAISADH